MVTLSHCAIVLFLFWLPALHGFLMKFVRVLISAARGMKTDSLSKIAAYVELSRPINGLIAFISALLGTMFAAGIEQVFTLQPLIVAASALLILSAGNAVNDFCDTAIDRINKPNRPIPSGRVRRRSALVFAVVLLCGGTSIGFFVNGYAVAIAALVSISLVSYAVWLKRTPLIGNLLVGLLTGLTFIAGGVAVESVRGTLVPAMFAFLFTTAREIVKDIEDVEGDAKYRAQTIAVWWDKRAAVCIALGFMFAVVVFSPFPYLLGWYSWHYFVVIVFGVDIVLTYLAVRLWKDASKTNAARIQRWMKWDIFVGLGAVYLGAFL